MKLILRGFLLCVLFYSCSDEPSKQISLTVSLVNYPVADDLILYELTDKFVPFDTALRTTEGDYFFSKLIRKTGFYQLQFSNNQSLNLILKPESETKVKLDADHVLTSASIVNNHDSYNILKAERLALGFEKEINALVADFTVEKLKKSVKDSLMQTIDTLKEIRKQALLNVINENKMSLSIMPVLFQKSGNYSFFHPIVDRDLFIEADTFLTRNYGYLQSVKKFHFQLDSLYCLSDSLKSVCIGDKMPDPKIPTYWKELLPLNRFKGKPVLIVFWQSDGVENNWLIPQIKEFSSRFKKREMEIYMISLDSLEKTWKTSIDYHRLTCWHLSDLKGTKSPLVERLGVRSVPFNFLIDKQGIIVSKNMWGDLLNSEVNKLITFH